MADVFPIEVEGAAVLAEVFAMLLGEAVQSGVALEVLRAMAAAVGIDVLENLAGERGAALEGNLIPPRLGRRGT